jgi:hypothetical protein
MEQERGRGMINSESRLTLAGRTTFEFIFCPTISTVVTISFFVPDGFGRGIKVSLSNNLVCFETYCVPITIWQGYCIGGIELEGENRI